MAACITDRCLQGDQPCPTPARCGVSPADLMVREARLALAAYSVGNLPRYDLHRANARSIADALGLQARKQPAARPARPTRPVPITLVEDDDFLKQEGAFRGLATAFWLLATIVCFCGFIAAVTFTAGALLRAHGLI